MYIICLYLDYLLILFCLHSTAAEPFLSGSSGTYVEAMYESWQNDRASVHKVVCACVCVCACVRGCVCVTLSNSSSLNIFL